MPDAVLTPGLLADDLVGVADLVRGTVHEALGTRPYVVDLVTITWSGTRPGDGTASVAVEAVSPAPRVPQYVRDEMRPGGRDEEGTIEVTEISGTYSEAELYKPPGAVLVRNVEFFWRVTDAHGQGARPRWYVPAAPPKSRRGDEKDAQADWSIRLRLVEPPVLP